MIIYLFLLADRNVQRVTVGGPVHIANTQSVLA